MKGFSASISTAKQRQYLTFNPATLIIKRNNNLKVDKKMINSMVVTKKLRQQILIWCRYSYNVALVYFTENW
ncbi:hypothetical protein HYN43_023695 [Mucilaginibacter celer]|uniref:Uncharacterized protein n=1 Tax=Mucilaginibacter celer TaxID=2305508 RepID=A0A494VT31_9SPHI|nr:hypothetical protein HYN43_023695 [Mucilaginibacter celer]